MIDWEKPYGEHFGGNGPARFTQDGTDYNAAGYELDADGSVVVDTVTEQPNTILEAAGLPQDLPQKFGESMQNKILEAVIETSAKTSAKVNPAAQDWSAFKAEVGEEAYAAMPKEDKRAGAVAKRLERMN